MGKKIKIYESEIKRATRRKLMENYLEEEDDREMSGAFHRKDFKPSKREKDVMGVFGDMYGQDIPPVVIRYMRKNPDHVLRRLSKIYPEIYMRHAPVQPDYRDYPDPIDVSDQYDEEGYYIDEATIEMSSDDFDKIKDMVGDETKDHTIKITEITKDLFKKFLNRK
jgi:hypothetical protein